MFVWTSPSRPATAAGIRRGRLTAYGAPTSHRRDAEGKCRAFVSWNNARRAVWPQTAAAASQGRPGPEGGA